MKHFKVYDRKDILSLTKIRRFETKLGERVHSLNDKSQLENSLKQSSAKYVLFGIPEDIGVRANHGVGGTDTTWLPFLSNLLNIQSNDFLTGDELILIGHFDFSDLKILIEQKEDTRTRS